MSVEQGNVVDFVTYDPKSDRVVLVMVEAREWGDQGALLPELQTKLNTYLCYTLDGRLACDFPTYAQKLVSIELRTQYPPSPREQQLLDIVAKEDLKPRGITFDWKLIS